MPKRIPFVQGGYYHLYNRGAGRQPIFFEQRNYVYLLRLLKKVSRECQVTVVAYCLLPNHYHWLLRQDGETPVGKVPARVFGSYTQAVNRAFERSGTLFEGPYKALAVETDAYFVNLCSYIHLNAVHHGLVDAPEAWPYSNYLEWIEKRPGTLVDRELVRAYFATPQAYEDCVRDFQQRFTFQEGSARFTGALASDPPWIERACLPARRWSACPALGPTGCFPQRTPAMARRSRAVEKPPPTQRQEAASTGLGVHARRGQALLDG